MSLVHVRNVTKTREPHVILNGVTWLISPGDRIGMIGANGSGKTTLLEIIAGLQEPTTGSVGRASGARIGYLRQIADLGDGETGLKSAIMSVFEDQRRLEVAMRDLSEQMANLSDDGDLEQLLKRFDRLERKHEVNGGYSYEYKIESTLRGLGFAENEFDKPVEVLSGGEKTRAALTRLLLEEPDLLLLDEPTNHLDIHAIEWLESFLRLEYKGAYVVVSHDRYFLDKVTTKTVELRNHRIAAYRGNYSAHLKQRATNELTQQRAYEQQQEQIAKEEEFIRRHMGSQRTREAKGRLKRLERLERIDKPDAPSPSMRLRVEADRRSGKDALTARNLAMGYDDAFLFENLSFEVHRGDVLGITGANGAGKSTLFRLIMGEEEPIDGSVRLGASLEVGHLDQEHRALNPSRTVKDEIRSLMPFDASEGMVRSYAAPFLFRGDDLTKSVSALSGGEKTRLVLAKLLYGKPNLLLLDEPTNHLDIPSREALETALSNYPATILLITHDRYLLDKLATKLLVFEDDGVRFWKYSYEDYMERRQERERIAKRQRIARKAPRAAKSG